VPIARYFILVGGTLAALLFIAGWYFPAPPAMFSNQTTVFDETIIRIRSERKWGPQFRSLNHVRRGAASDLNLLPLRRHSGHGRACWRLDPVANDPQQANILL